MKASGAISISPVSSARSTMRTSIRSIQRVVDRPQIGIDLLAHVAGQEAEPFAGFDRRPRQDDAVDFLALEHLDRMRDREPGLAGAGRTGAEHQRMVLERADIGVLRRGAGAHRALAQIDFLEGGRGRRGSKSNSEPCAMAWRIAPSTSPVVTSLAALELFVQAFEHAARLFAGLARAFDA